MNKSINFNLIKSFCRTNHFRESLAKPTYIPSDEILFATDSIKMIIVNCNLDEYEPFDKDCYNYELKSLEKQFKLNGSVVYNPFLKDYIKNPDQEFLGVINISQLKRLGESIRQKDPKYIPKYMQCGSCHGECTITCPCCDNTKECSTCKGEGEVIVDSMLEGGYYKYPEDHCFMIYKRPYSIMQVVDIAEKLDSVGIQDVYVMKHEENRTLFMAKLNDVYYHIILMGLGIIKKNQTQIEILPF